MKTEPATLRRSIIRVLRKQGYSIRGRQIYMPDGLGKDDIRAMHKLATQHKLATARDKMRPKEHRLLGFIANGREIDPPKIRPRLLLVRRGTEEELLFRYACLHWSVPVSSGYGRRLRFLVIDDSNGKLIGLFGLGDPVYSMACRDQYIGWDDLTKRDRLYHIMDAYVLGAVPPYSMLLCGKLVALMALSNEVRRQFRRQYAGRLSLMKGALRPPYLVMLTTTSAFGRSSMYNRIRLDGFDYWIRVGFTAGSGDFHFSNGIYAKLRAFVERHCQPTAKSSTWGKGFRNRREVVRKCLRATGLSEEFAYHGVRREVIVAPLGRNARRFLRSEVVRPCFYDWPAEILAEVFRERWLLPRSRRTQAYQDFNRQSYRLWGPGE